MENQENMNTGSIQQTLHNKLHQHLILLDNNNYPMQQQY
jgi:hypothetical protein